MWVSCAVGNQCDIIPRDSNGAPKDGILHGLGVEFSIDIDNKNYTGAKEVLEKIETRSAELISKIKIKK